MYSSKKMNISDVLQMLLQHSGVTESELSRKICIPCATLNKLKTGKINDPRSSTLLTIAKYFDISVDQLLGNTPIDFNTQECLVNIPIISINELLNNFANNHDLSDHQQSIDCNNEANHDTSYFKTTVNVSCKQHSLFAFRINGDAMSPYFDENTILVIDREYTPQNKNFVLAFISNTNEILVRQLLLDGKCKLLKPINNLFPTITVQDGDIIIGVVINSIRQHF